MHIIIMAGGSGTRFWPASRESRPKQFLNITGFESLIEQTFHRVAPLTEKGHIHFVINACHRQLMEEIFAGHPVTILAEPRGRNTAPCIGLAAIHLRRDAGDIPMVVLPADHFIADDQAFRSTLQAAAQLAQADSIITIGIPPTRPETGFGYILKGTEQTSILSHEVYRVERFIEKPDLQTAVQYLTSGHYLWNSGIFVFTPRTILEEIQEHLPSVYQGLVRLEQQLGRPGYDETLAEVYNSWPSVSIDYGLMERTSRPVYVVPGLFGWSDVGSWEALYELRRSEQDRTGNLIEGPAMAIECHDSYVSSRGDRLVVALGLTDVLIVDTPDAILVADRRRSQEVRRVVEQLKQNSMKQV